MQNQRVRLFREHKYMISVLCRVLELSARVDFSTRGSREGFIEEMTSLRVLWKSHGDNEEARIIPILKAKQSPLWEEILKQHGDHETKLEAIDQLLTSIEAAQDSADIHHLGYLLTLELRNYFIEALKHFDFEERILMPELQRLLSDDELKELHHISYRQMLPEQLTHMMEVLFPHMNIDDKLCYLQDIRLCQPHKFDKAWAGICSSLEEWEKSQIASIIEITVPNENAAPLDMHYPWEKQKSSQSEAAIDYHKRNQHGESEKTR